MVYQYLNEDDDQKLDNFALIKGIFSEDEIEEFLEDEQFNTLLDKTDEFINNAYWLVQDHWKSVIKSMRERKLNEYKNIAGLMRNIDPQYSKKLDSLVDKKNSALNEFLKD